MTDKIVCEIQYIVEIKKLEPVKYWIVAGEENYGWWIFKRKRFIAYVHSEFMSIGPFYYMNEAVSIKRQLECS